ncbi:MAG: FAD-dependent oxidoreductase, partial [Treponema sp.]|nr:FAD-dependent oxidoreductase [Treponema sp.]
METMDLRLDNIRILEKANLCVVGGSCTGVFAAIRAARLGLKVALVEQQNCFGGVATNGLVNIWHSVYDLDYKKQIIAGLTGEIIDRLKKRDAVQESKETINSFTFNSEELKIELDEITAEHSISSYLHTRCVRALFEGGKVTGIVVAGKFGLGIIKADFFIDATGDGDVCRDLNLPRYRNAFIQPSTTGAKMLGLSHDLHDMPMIGDQPLNELLEKHRATYNLPEGWGWSTDIPGLQGITFQALTRIHEDEIDDGKSLTRAEVEGRRQIRIIMDIIRAHNKNGNAAGLVSLPSYIGIRETCHVRCRYRIAERDILSGASFPDTIGHGTYRVDIHHQDKPGVTFRYLDGTQMYYRSGCKPEPGRWREESPDYPRYYNIPLSSLTPVGFDNLLLAGRMLDADEGAFGAVRVMVNLNQTG